jgi:hypothetical protein
VATVSFGPVRTEVVAEGVSNAGSGTTRLRAHLDTDGFPEGVAPGARVRAVVRPADVLRFVP